MQKTPSPVLQTVEEAMTELPKATVGPDEAAAGLEEKSLARVHSPEAEFTSGERPNGFVCWSSGRGEPYGLR